MSRWIDAEWLISLYKPYENYKGREWGTSIGTILANIDDAPSIDIVFCKECKHEQICNHSVQHTTHDAYSVTIGYKSVEWCSYGEREGE